MVAHGCCRGIADTQQVKPPYGETSCPSNQEEKRLNMKEEAVLPRPFPSMLYTAPRC